MRGKAAGIECMLSNLNKIVKGQEIRNEKDKERNRLYYYLEIAQTLKDNQKKPKQEKEKRGRGKRRRGIRARGDWRRI